MTIRSALSMNEPIDIRLDETLLCGELQDCDSVDRWNSKTTRSRAAVQVVDQDSVRSTFKGQLQCFRFTSMQAVHRLRLCHGNKLKPRTRRNNPVLYFLRSTQMEQFV